MKLTNIILIGILFFSQAVCAELPAADDYYFSQKEYEITELSVKIVVLKDIADLRKTLEHYGVEEVSTSRKAFGPFPPKLIIQAFSILRPASQECVIYITDPNWKYQPEYYGHELAHCIWGRWHREE